MIRTYILSVRYASRPFGTVPFIPGDQRRDCLSPNRRDLTSHESDMSITFLGTGSCIPTTTRGVTCMNLRYKTINWLFDCGEASQRQLQASRVRFSKINKIFITHMHGDHIFGLAAVLCTMGSAQVEYNSNGVSSLDIYGPEGLRDYLRVVIQLSYSRTVVPYRVHELKGLPSEYRPKVTTFRDSRFGELTGGRDIEQSADGMYRICNDDGLQVVAAPMKHTVPCVGYVVTEDEPAPNLKMESLTDIFARNRSALVDRFGVPERVFSVLKKLSPGESYTFPDGSQVMAEDILCKRYRSRKVVIMGDNSCGKLITGAALGADVLVHEATNAWIEGSPDSPRLLEFNTRERGHSTPQMAGQFAKEIGAKQLILTHFSQRYPGDDSAESVRTMTHIEQLARESSGLSHDGGVIAAWDFMTLDIVRKSRLD